MDRCRQKSSRNRQNLEAVFGARTALDFPMTSYQLIVLSCGKQPKFTRRNRRHSNSEYYFQVPSISRVFLQDTVILSHLSSRLRRDPFAFGACNHRLEQPAFIRRHRPMKRNWCRCIVCTSDSDVVFLQMITSNILSNRLMFNNTLQQPMEKFFRLFSSLQLMSQLYQLYFLDKHSSILRVLWRECHSLTLYYEICDECLHSSVLS